MEIFHQRFQYTPSNLSDFMNHFASTIYVTIFPAECLTMKLLIDISLYYTGFLK